MLDVQLIYRNIGIFARDPDQGDLLGVMGGEDPKSVYALKRMRLEPQASALSLFLQSASSLRHLILPLSVSWILQARGFWPLLMRMHHIEFNFQYATPGPTQNAVGALRSVIQEFWSRSHQPLSGRQIQDLAEDPRLQAAAFALQDEAIAAKVAESWNDCADKGPNEPLRHPRAKHSYADADFGPMAARWGAMCRAVNDKRSGTMSARSWMPPQVPSDYLQSFKVDGSRA